MKRISRNTRLTVLAWVAALSLAWAQCPIPSASADEPKPAAAATIAESSPEKSVEKPDPPAPKPADEPSSAEKPAPPVEPDPVPSDPPAETSERTKKAPPAEDPGDRETAPDGAPAETPSDEVPSAPVAEDGSSSGPESPPAPEPDDAGTPEPDELSAFLDEELAEDAIEPMSIGPDDVCSIGTDGYPTLDAAIAAATGGQTIVVLKSITHTSPVVIDGKNLTFDLDGHAIEIDTGGNAGSTALLVKNSIVTLTGGGYLNASGVSTGVRAENGTVTVRYATASQGTGAYALSGGRITVQGDAKGYAIGALAYGTGSAVTVDDDAMATGHSSRGAEAMAGGQVTVKNALSSGTNGVGAAAASSGTVTVAQRAEGPGTGAWAATGGTITIDGGLAGATYLRLGEVDKAERDAQPLTTREGYRTYTDGTSTVWVKGLPLAANVCAIGDQEFPTLDDALARVDGTAAAPTVIRLLTSIDYDKTLALGNRHVVFDLNGFDLMVDGGAQTGLLVIGGTVTYTGMGGFVVSGAERVVEVNTGGLATVTGIRIAGAHSSGAYAGGDGSRVVVDGEIRTTGVHDRVIGAYAEGDGAQVRVNGAIRIEGGNTYGASSYGGGRITVQVGSGEAITVTGDFGIGANPRYGGEVIVTGAIVASGADAAGVVTSGGIAQVTGDVSVAGDWSIGVVSQDDGDVLITGQLGVAGARAVGISAQMGEGSGGRVRVTGTVTVTGDDALGTEAYTRQGSSPASLVVIDGRLNAPDYLLVDGVTRTVDSEDDTEPSGHWLYHGRYGSLVKIRNGQPVLAPPVVVTRTVTGITTTGADLSGEVTSDGGAEVGERGFVYSTSPDPTLADGTKLPAGSGVGTYRATASGLLAATTYYVRAYATNSEGTSYGGTESFVTQSEPSIEPTPTPEPEPSETAEPAPEDSTDSDELPMTGPGEGQGWLLGLMVATISAGLLILSLKDRSLRRREKGGHAAA